MNEEKTSSKLESREENVSNFNEYTFRESPSSQSPDSSNSPTKIVLVMPGGGIRAAAYSLGCLKYFTENPNYEIEALSCVSGGAYTGAAYVQHLYYYMKSGLNFKGKQIQKENFF